MLKVGLTGSIAVGKSFVCECFRKLGCHVLDADQTAREVVAPGSAGLAEIVRHFGKLVLTDVGELDRKQLASIVFANESERQRLNTIVHPLVLERQDALLKEWELRDPEGIVIVDAALMIESGGYRRFDELLVVWCRPEIQLQRLMSRDGLSETEAVARINAQMPQEEKKQYASRLIDTSEGRKATRVQVEVIYRDWMATRQHGDRTGQ
jgi:dephospho-CoA kinase